MSSMLINCLVQVDIQRVLNCTNLNIQHVSACINFKLLLSFSGSFNDLFLNVRGIELMVRVAKLISHYYVKINSFGNSHINTSSKI